ncbi:MAG: glycosyltransferase [Erythrobacter sp.]
MSIEHFLLTRFNIASEGREKTIRKRPGWLERRFELFEQFCLPSVAAQTNQDFCWFIYFDCETAPEFRNRIDNLRQRRNFEARYVASFSNELASLDISKRMLPQTERVITTRLDNDDALARFFLTQVRRSAENSPNGTILNFPSGLELASGKLYRSSHRENSFVSLVESSKDIRTVWSDPHNMLARRWRYHQIPSAPAWLQAIHQENVANRVKGQRAKRSDDLLAFQIVPEPNIDLPNAFVIALDRAILYPARVIRESIIGAAKYFRDLALRSG